MTKDRQIQFQAQTQNPAFDVVTDLPVTEVYAHRDQIEIIDVRRADEWQGEFGHIANAKLVTLDTLPSRMSEISADRAVVFVCRSGGRSAQATAMAKQYGLANVFNMQGGMIEWTKQNLPAVQKNEFGK